MIPSIFDEQYMDQIVQPAGTEDPNCRHQDFTVEKHKDFKTSHIIQTIQCKSCLKMIRRDEDLIKHKAVYDKELDNIEQQIQKKADAIEKIKQNQSRYKPVAGRRKLAEGKKARAENKGSTEFEMELVHYLDIIMSKYDKRFHNFRSPASKTPVDVWSLADVSEGYEIDNISRVYVYQCKTTRDTQPPRIITKEFNDFRKFAEKIGARPCWVDRWKKNKNVYIRRIRLIKEDGSMETIEEDFSPILKKGGGEVIRSCKKS